MKLRIRGNSVRLRLTQGEVATLGHDGSVRADCRFPSGTRLAYSLHSDAGAEEVSAGFSDGVLDVRVPRRIVTQWVDSEQVSIRGAQQLAGGDTLQILIEKDFACLTPREGEDESDNFPHPQAG